MLQYHTACQYQICFWERPNRSLIFAEAKAKHIFSYSLSVTLFLSLTLFFVVAKWSLTISITLTLFFFFFSFFWWKTISIKTRRLQARQDTACSYRLHYSHSQKRNDMFTTFLQQILSNRLLLLEQKSNLSVSFKFEPIITNHLWFVVKLL